MKNRIIILLSAILVASSACNLRLPTRPGASASVTPSPFQPESFGTEVLASTDAAPSETMAPTGALTSTSTPGSPPPQSSQTATATLPYATLQVTPASTRVPKPADPIIEPEGQVTILILGATPLTQTDFNTDIIMLLTLRPDDTVNLTSFPRDLYVYIPGWRMQRLSAAQAHGGFDLTRSTLAYNFGFKPDYYILTTLDGYQAIIDSMGGIDVKVAKTFHAPRDGYPNGFTVNAGTVHMDGATALWYVRPYIPAADADRMRRSQEVLYAMGKKLISLNAILHIPDIYNQFKNNVATSLDLAESINLMPRLQNADPGKFTYYALSGGQVTPWVEPSTKEHYLLPKPDAIRQVLQKAIGLP